MKTTFKLYSLVWVSEPCEHVQGDYLTYVGQVLSMRTPDGTYMVRRVPGHPGTLVELPERFITERTERRFPNVSYAVVSGKGSFPADMLRYDQASPVNFKLQEVDGRLTTVMLPGYEGSDLIVAKVVTPGREAWTTARWESFMWTTSEIRTLPIGAE